MTNRSTTESPPIREMTGHPPPLTIKQLREYPPEAINHVIPEATRKGSAQVGEGRDGPFELYYTSYGQGPTRIILISGHAAGTEYWCDIVQEFGVQNADKYTVLVYENRGIGQSKAPCSFWTIKDLVRDAEDLLNHVKWTEEKSVHIVGHSMGGMVAMALAIDQPSLTASLTLLSTTSNYRRDFSVCNVAKAILKAPLLLTADSRLNITKSQTFGQAWLDAPDPTGTFLTNGDAWAAKFITWPVHDRAALLQSPAAYRHHVKPADLKVLGERLGQGRIGIIHGTSDKTIPVVAGEKLFEELGGKDAGIKIVILNGVGHIPHFERLKEVVLLIEGAVNGTLNTS